MSHLLQNVVCMVACGLVGVFSSFVVTSDPIASHFAAGSSAYIFLVCVWAVVSMAKEGAEDE